MPAMMWSTTTAIAPITSISESILAISRVELTACFVHSRKLHQMRDDDDDCVQSPRTLQPVMSLMMMEGLFQDRYRTANFVL